MSLTSLMQLFTDPYERKARALPGLLLVLPVVVPVVLLLGPKNPYLAALLTLFGGCGAVFLLARTARTLGKNLEGRLILKWGGLPSTILLRHRDTHLDPHTKRRYHENIAMVTKMKLPSTEEEQRDPVAADDAYRASVTRLRELTRSAAFKLLANENANYGFHRNMQGLRWLGASVCCAVLFFVFVTSPILLPGSPYLDFNALAEMDPARALSAIIAGGMLLAWLFIFSESATRKTGETYSERLFEAAAQLANARQEKASTPSRKKKTATAE